MFAHQRIEQIEICERIEMKLYNIISLYYGKMKSLTTIQKKYIARLGPARFFAGGNIFETPSMYFRPYQHSFMKVEFVQHAHKMST